MADEQLPATEGAGLNSEGGSLLLLPISNLVGLPIDQVNFMICQLFAVALGVPFHTFLGPHRVSPTVRHVVEIVIGLLITVFCFGWQVKHLAFQGFICLAFIYFLKPGVMEKAVFVFGMGYLCIAHIYRLYYDYGGYTLDITGPLMVSTQRLTSLAYNVVDGQARDDSKLSKHAKSLAVKSKPSLLEFTSYTFSFHMILCGPFCFYKDYIAFIDGSNYMEKQRSDDRSVTDSSGSICSTALEKPAPPCPLSALKWYAALVIGTGLVSQLQPLIPCSYLLDPLFADRCLIYKMIYITVATSLARPKYYFAWKLSEAANTSAGLGFNGYDEKGKAKWDLIDNADIYSVELSTSLKVLLDNWNKMTTQWLRYVVYERYHSTLAVFLFSAFWHGFYAGYYLTFIGGALFIHASRQVRRHIRPFFQTTAQKAFIYDVLTFIATRLSLAYLAFPFVLLQFWMSIQVYRLIYFWLHLVVIVIMVVMNFVPAKPSSTREERAKQP